jgi:hypothetical protein
LNLKDWDEPIQKPYRKLLVDDLPIIVGPETLDETAMIKYI